MTDFIVDKFNEIIYNACERYGRENELSGDKMQILFRLNEEDDVEYDLLQEYKKLKNLTFNEILNVKIDFRGYSIIVPSFIKQTLKSYSEQLETSPTNLSVMCVIAEKKVVLCLYKGFDFVKQISLEEEL
jgi:hypothetical protein